MKSLSKPQQVLMSEVVKLTKLVVVMPATNATSERSFSALRRLKSYLRSTMSQSRLNHLMFIHVNHDKVDSLSLLDIGNNFVALSDHRKSVFGTFTGKDNTLSKTVNRDVSTQTVSAHFSESLKSVK
jgi:hypothetical protein